MHNKTVNQPYNYPLRTPKRGILYIAESDPRNNKDSLRNLRALYDDVQVIKDDEISGRSVINNNESLIIGSFSSEGINPLSILSQPVQEKSLTASDIKPILTLPTVQTVTLAPPINMSVNPVHVYGTNGSHTINLNVSFDSYIQGAVADDFEIIMTDQTIQHPGTVTSITKNSNTITWNVVTSATNYVIETSGRAPILVSAPAANTTTVSYTFSPALSGPKSITVTPYNNTGISGTAKTVSLTF
jgi:hypothetical protein